MEVLESLELKRFQDSIDFQRNSSSMRHTSNAFVTPQVSKMSGRIVPLVNCSMYLFKTFLSLSMPPGFDVLFYVS